MRSNDVTKSTASQTTTTTSNSNSLPGIDLDAVAAMMQGGSSRGKSSVKTQNSLQRGAGGVSNIFEKISEVGLKGPLSYPGRTYKVCLSE